MRDLEDAELMDALGETELLHALGNRSLPAASPPIWSPIPAGYPVQAHPPAPPGTPYPVTVGVDALALDGTRMAVISGRKFELSEAEMKKVVVVLEKAYARAMRGELARVRESVLGTSTKAVREMQEAPGPANPQDLRSLSRSRPVEITYADTPPDGALPELRAAQPGSTKVLDMFGEEAGGGVATLSALVGTPHEGVDAVPERRVPVRRNRVVPVPTTEGGGTPSGGPD